MVVAWAPVISASRRAALPVGAHRRTVRRSACRRSTSARIVIVLPVPGPPVRIASRRSSTARTTAHCASVGARSPVGRSIAPRRRRGSSSISARTWRARRVSTRVHRRVEDAVALDHELAAGGELVDAVVGVGAEQAPRALGQLGAGEVAVAVVLGLVQRVAQPGVQAPGESGGVPSAWASASAVAKPMPSSSVRPYGSERSVSMAPGP